jgi:hypothetical protein
LLEGERAMENLTPRFSFAINFHSQPQIEKARPFYISTFEELFNG